MHKTADTVRSGHKEDELEKMVEVPIINVSTDRAMTENNSERYGMFFFPVLKAFKAHCLFGLCILYQFCYVEMFSVFFSLSGQLRESGEHK